MRLSTGLLSLGALALTLAATPAGAIEHAIVSRDGALLAAAVANAHAVSATAKVRRGEDVYVLGAQGDFRRVRARGGEGWVAAADLIQDDIATATRVRCAVDARQDPESEAAVVKRLEAGAVVIVVGGRFPWVQVDVDGKTRAWIPTSAVAVGPNAPPCQ